MTDLKLSTDSYKGVRDFYPEDMAVQRYIFDTWAKTAESFGFERYDASILEPSDLYKAKGAENEELVNEQTYTFTDRGEREVTLRPEMTPTVARMVAGRRRELQFPLRWYSIPNLFRYERPQRGRLREHWQFNCDLFGGDSVAADVELIALAVQTLRDFGATNEMFTIRLNDREDIRRFYKQIGIEDLETQNSITRLNDKKDKLAVDEYTNKLTEIVGVEAALKISSSYVVDDPELSNAQRILESLKTLSIENVVIDRSLARGFDYYTGTIFEIFDTSSENNRALLGGGRYDNLTSMFGGEPISGIGFGMGDVTMRDFLETHNLLPDHIKSTGPNVVIIPMTTQQTPFAQKVATDIRAHGPSVTVDFGTKKIGEKIGRASDKGARFVCVIGENEVTTNQLTIKNLSSGAEHTGTLGELMNIFDRSNNES